MPEWPAGWGRTRRPSRARFDRNLTFARALRDLQAEVGRLNGSELRVDHDRQRRGKTDKSSWAGQPDDTGVVVYFRLPGGRPIVFACDAWDRTEHNVRAITYTIEAKRAIERWGSATASREFEGYAQLPPGGNAAQAWQMPTSQPQEPPHEVLGIAPDAHPIVIKAAWKAAMKSAHPDHGGTNEMVHRLNNARDEMLRAHQDS